MRRLEGVFRIPRDSEVSNDDGYDGKDETCTDHDEDTKSYIDSEIVDQAAMLQLLASRGISAPKLLAFDATATNAIHGPYVFQEYCEGTPLGLVYENMSFNEKLNIADSLVEAMLSMERVKFTEIGSILSTNVSAKATKGSYFLGTKGPDLELSVRGFDVDTNRGSLAVKPYTSIMDLISRQFDAWYQMELKDGESQITDMWQRLREIFEDMKALGFFSTRNETNELTAKSVLYHWDLEPRNILVKRIQNQSGNNHTTDEMDASKTIWAIDKIVDWDKVLAVPPLLTRKPPTWLWDFSDDTYRSSRPSISSDYDGDVDLFSPSRYDSEGSRLSQEDQQTREHFEERFISGLAAMYGEHDKKTYQEDAYGKGRWIRRLARFAIYGASDGQNWKRFDHFSEEWPKVRSQYTE